MTRVRVPPRAKPEPKRATRGLERACPLCGGPGRIVIGQYVECLERGVRGRCEGPPDVDGGWCDEDTQPMATPRGFGRRRGI